jgi:hypothetical protein
MDSNLITKKDLIQFRVDLLHDLNKLIRPPASPSADPKWVKSGHVRKLLEISHDTLQVLRIKGLLNPKKINGRYYYNLKDVNDLFNKSKPGSI